ncbi:hypothetical protein VCHA53O463_80005 [Vibrio chagasii]|nr:hypothetical protein VCHA53O463_80005 [Vibrio chagasii]
MDWALPPRNTLQANKTTLKGDQENTSSLSSILNTISQLNHYNPHLMA